MTRLHELLQGRKVVACVGSGGVGKTTSAAALALRFAVEGKRALVLTIDPARRLANSLGLQTLGNRETRIDLAPLAERGTAARGELHAMMLDLKLTWDELVRRDAPSPQRARDILDNKLYQTLSTAMAGSLEYMAMEKVAELASSGRYDVVVLDTPPTANALDFLHAPDRILDVLDNDAMRILLGPMLKAGRVGLKLFALPSSLILKTLSRFTGADFLRDLATFMIAFDGMFDGFKVRAGQVKRLLAGHDSAFVLVTSPSPLTIDEALFFHRALEHDGIATAAVVVNRVQRDPRRFGGPESAGRAARGAARRADQGCARRGRRGTLGAALAHAHRAGDARRSRSPRGGAARAPARPGPAVYGATLAEGRARPARPVADRSVPGRAVAASQAAADAAARTQEQGGRRHGLLQRDHRAAHGEEAGDARPDEARARRGEAERDRERPVLDLQRSYHRRHRHQREHRPGRADRHPQCARARDSDERPVLQARGGKCACARQGGGGGFVGDGAGAEREADAGHLAGHLFLRVRRAAKPQDHRHDRRLMRSAAAGGGFRAGGIAAARLHAFTNDALERMRKLLLEPKS
jgi:anion-transporting  ArsA/GET3 family ATPase